jgi:hypothetical protein
MVTTYLNLKRSREAGHGPANSRPEEGTGTGPSGVASRDRAGVARSLRPEQRGQGSTGTSGPGRSLPRTARRGIVRRSGRVPLRRRGGEPMHAFVRAASEPVR